MKRSITLVFLTLFATSSFAQTLTLSETEVFLMLEESVEYDEFFITNTGSVDFEVGIELDVACYHPDDVLKMQICIGLACWDPRNIDGVWNPVNSPLFTIPAGQTTGEFSLHQFSVGTLGSEWRIWFFDRNNPDDRTLLTVYVDTCDPSVGVDENVGVGEFSAYPNPANTEVNITWNTAETPHTIQMLDLVGNVVLQQEVAPSQTSVKLELSTLANGVYVYRWISATQRSAAQALVISH
jgi:hypothetical protein